MTDPIDDTPGAPQATGSPDVPSLETRARDAALTATEIAAGFAAFSLIGLGLLLRHKPGQDDAAVEPSPAPAEAAPSPPDGSAPARPDVEAALRRLSDATLARPSARPRRRGGGAPKTRPVRSPATL